MLGNALWSDLLRSYVLRHLRGVHVMTLRCVCRTWRDAVHACFTLHRYRFALERRSTRDECIVLHEDVTWAATGMWPKPRNNELTLITVICAPSGQAAKRAGAASDDAMLVHSVGWMDGMGLGDEIGAFEESRSAWRCSLREYHQPLVCAEACIDAYNVNWCMNFPVGNYRDEDDDDDDSGEVSTCEHSIDETRRICGVRPDGDGPGYISLVMQTEGDYEVERAPADALAPRCVTSVSAQLNVVGFVACESRGNRAWRLCA